MGGISASPGRPGGHHISVLDFLYLVLGFGSLILSVALWKIGQGAIAGPLGILCPILLSFYVYRHPILSVLHFTLWMIAAVVASMVYPGPFVTIAGYPMKTLSPYLIMFIMFGMGLNLTVDDFKRVFSMPQAIFIGVILQYTVMPFGGKIMAMTLLDNPEVQAGVVLVGASPAGVASNVINFLAQNNLALSVTMTAFTTILSPVVTPAYMQWLGGAYVPVNFWNLMRSMLQVVLFPVIGGLVFNMLSRNLGRVHDTFLKVFTGFKNAMPRLAMIAICLNNAIMTGNAREQLLVGKLLVTIIFVCAVHNIIGYILGYWGARLLGMNIRNSRTASIEVGMQNSGMAATLAQNVLNSPLAAAPGVVFSSWHNISGALVASYWARKQPQDNS